MSRLSPSTGERVEIPDRPHISDKRRAELHLAAKGRCQGEGCGKKVGKGEYHIDHDIQRWLNGDDSDDNLQVLCLDCHADKTRLDAGIRAKTKGMAKLSLSVPRTVSATPIRSRGFGDPVRVPARKGKR